MIADRFGISGETDVGGCSPQYKSLVREQGGMQSLAVS